ncbi:MAG: type II secretion system F family protein [Candidatus Aenigmarchaeota archaeon]|nr:type II secretion system F family protein [Candidatus Aenigmarchaeota archaeon]
MLESYFKRAYSFYGEVAQKLSPNFGYLKEDLKKSGLRYTAEEYLSMALFISLILFCIEIPVITFIFSFFTHVVWALLMAIAISASLTMMVFFLFTTYPKTQYDSIAVEIERGLPFSVSYMTATASSDAPPIEIFKAVSKLDEYPELKEQAMNVIRDVEGLGLDLSGALKREAKRTPSRQYKELLIGIDSTLRSGGDLSLFLSNRANTLFTNYQRKIKDYSNLLSMIVEIYITVVIVGSIFFTILSTVMSMMGGAQNILVMQFFISFVILPVISIALAYYIKMVSP